MTSIMRNHPKSLPGTRARPGPLGRLGRLAYRQRGRVLLLWLGGLAAAVALSLTLSGGFQADYSAPGSDSRAAQELLEKRFPTLSGATVNVVIGAPDGMTSPAVKADVEAVLDRFTAMPHVQSAEDPYSTPGAISADGRTLVSHLRLDVTNPADMPVADSKKLLAAAESATQPGFEVVLGGQPIQRAEEGNIGSEGIGIAAAAVILLLTFGTVVAAGLPIVVAIAGLVVSSLLTGVVAAIIDVPDFSTAIAAMIGIGIGIDYVLLMATRFREWRTAGLDPEAATAATLDTAGRSVMVAGGTVVVSMLGLFAMGLSFMRGAAVVTIVAVLVVMAAAVTLFPALLGYLGRHIDRLRVVPGRRSIEAAAGDHIVPRRVWLRWGRVVERHRILASLGGAAILLILAAPFLGVRFGFPDAGNSPESTSSRKAYDMVAEDFGRGTNGPLLLAAKLGHNSDEPALQALTASIQNTPGVAAVTPPRVNPAGDTAVLTVVPATGPQDKDTEDLVRTLRDQTIPAATAGTGTEVHVGGATATAIDTSENIAKRVPLLICGVVALSMLLLLVSFRSLLITVTAAVMNLLSVAAAYGIVAFALQGGWFGQLLGIDTQTPMPAFIPVIMFAVLFGLSMDYEVFLVSRMREAWARTGRNSRAIVEGLAGTGRVITAAAAIMIAVFAAFILGADVILKVFGVGMAAAILIDATVVRLLLVPAVMHLLGRANWWMPAHLARRLPQLHVEGHPEAYLPQPLAKASPSAN